MKSSKNNKGFTLVEVIIGVVILGIIATTIFLSFITSARIAAKSQEVGEATLLAESVAEQFATLDLGIKHFERDDYTDFTPNEIEINGVKANLTEADESGGKKYTYTFNNLELDGNYDNYNVEVILNNTGTANTTGLEKDYQIVNSNEIAQQNEPDAFLSQINDNSLITDPDVQADTQFKLNVGYDHGGVTVDEKKRIITITIDKDGETYTASMQFNYIYEYKVSGNVFPLTINISGPIIAVPFEDGGDDNHVIYAIFRQLGIYTDYTKTDGSSYDGYYYYADNSDPYKPITYTSLDQNIYVNKLGIDSIDTVKFAEEVRIVNNVSGDETFDIFLVNDNEILNGDADSEKSGWQTNYKGTPALVFPPDSKPTIVKDATGQKRENINIYTNLETAKFSHATSSGSITPAGDATSLDENRHITEQEKENILYGLTVNVRNEADELLYTLETTLDK